MRFIVQLLCRLVVWTAYAAYKIEGLNALFLVMPSKMIVPILRKYGAKIGENVIMHSPLIIHNAGNDYSNLMIGNNVYLGRGIFLDLKDKIILSDRATLSMRVMILTHTDVGESQVKEFVPVSHAPVIIEKDAYLGANATVLEGVRVGEKAVVGAGALVRHHVPSLTVVVGNPAREIKKLG